jgi:aspartate/methionine/tyrosine aminotransferase
MFSSRVPGDLRPNRLARALQRARRGRRPLLDLTLANPTVAGITYSEGLLRPLTSQAALRYEPSPFGTAEAREAVAADYRRRGISVASERVVLTASTSDAYSLLFKLLCAPAGDHVMVPVPSYPLFVHLTQLDGVGCIPYRLDYHGRWTIEFQDLDRQWLNTVRALLIVSPNNPTGSVVSNEDLETLQHRCADRDAALILDEVFADYPLHVAGPDSGFGIRHGGSHDSRLTTPDARIPIHGCPHCLSFRLGGLSKSAGLPQVKLGWIAVDGPATQVDQALERLELICDTYLSVSTPVQVAAPALIEAGGEIRRHILERVRGNYERLAAAVHAHPAIELLHAEAGWSAVLRVPATRSEDDLVLELLESDGVLVHPGFFFDFPHEAFVVVSLLPDPQIFDEGIARLMERADA